MRGIGIAAALAAWIAGAGSASAEGPDQASDNLRYAAFVQFAAAHCAPLTIPLPHIETAAAIMAAQADPAEVARARVNAAIYVRMYYPIGSDAGACDWLRDWLALGGAADPQG